MNRVVAIDIGGANIKGADGRGWSTSRAFPLWRQPELLSAALGDLLAEAPAAQRVVATMTGELADCFATKAEGVAAIVAALANAAGGRNVAWFVVDGGWLDADAAIGAPERVAASNWSALARCVARELPEAGLLVDCGSTTTDVIPLSNGRVQARGIDDPTRLMAGELIYAGVERTPVAGLVARLPWRGGWCPVSRELFATTWDVYLLRGELPEEPDSRHTADGRPATCTCAHDRMARVICADRSTFDGEDARRAADHVARVQQAELECALQRMAVAHGRGARPIVVSGQGEFLARRAIGAVFPGVEVVSLATHWGAALSRVAPAHALARLAIGEGR